MITFWIIVLIFAPLCSCLTVDLSVDNATVDWSSASCSYDVSLLDAPALSLSTAAALLHDMDPPVSLNGAMYVVSLVHLCDDQGACCALR